MTQIYHLVQMKDQGPGTIIVTIGHYGSRAEAEHVARKLFPDPRERSFHTYIEVLKLDQVR